MTPDERRRAFAFAFIAQARSDWAAYRVLSREHGLPMCHSLHYLQMVCEKVAKAYRLRDTKAAVDDLVSRHAGFAKFVGPFLSAALKDDYRGRDGQMQRIVSRTRALAREIEKLAPSVDRLASPENAEYPWERDERVVAPAAHSFPSLELLRQPGGRAFLNLIERALDGFEQLALS